MRFKLRPWRGKLLLLLTVVGVLALLGCTPTQSVPKGWSGGVISGDTLYLGSMEGKVVALDVNSGARLWQASLETSKRGGAGCATGGSATAIYGTPSADGSLVYIGGYTKEGALSRGRVYAFVPNKDEPRWVYPRDGYLTGPVVGGTVVWQGKVYVGSGNKWFYAFDAATGDKLWEFETGDKIWSTPAIGDGTIYIGSFDKKLYALDAASGSKKWEFETGGAIVATPLVYEDTVYIGSFDRYLYALNAADGSLKWKFMGENWFWTRPVTDGKNIYAACLDGKVYALDIKNGGEIAEFDLGSPISSSPVLINGSVIVATQEGRVYSLDITGKQQKLLSELEQKVFAPLVARDKHVYIHTEKDKLYALEVETGAIRELTIK